MVQCIALNDVEVQQIVTSSGNVYRIQDCYGSHKAAAPGPQAFLVEFPTPRGVIKPHFHRVPQYQVVVAGGGRIGRHELRRLS